VNVFDDGYSNADEYAEKVRAWRGVRDRMDDVVTALRNELDLSEDASRTDPGTGISS
jgi:hypothetical protein